MYLAQYLLPLSSLSLDCSDYQIPLLSLPRLFQTNLGTIPGIIPYFKSISEIPSHLRLPTPPGGLSVGLVWASDPSNRSLYKHKSIPLKLLFPRLLELVDLDLLDLHSLQVGEDSFSIAPMVLA